MSANIPEEAVPTMVSDRWAVVTGHVVNPEPLPEEPIEEEDDE